MSSFRSCLIESVTLSRTLRKGLLLCFVSLSRFSPRRDVLSCGLLCEFKGFSYLFLTVEWGVGGERGGGSYCKKSIVFQEAFRAACEHTKEC